MEIGIRMNNHREEERWDALKAFMEEEIPFNKHLGIRVTSLRRGHVILEVSPKSSFIGDPIRPALHGGLVATLADTAGGLAAFSVVEVHKAVCTIDMRVDYIRPSSVNQMMYAESEVLRLGQHIVFTQTRVYQDSPELLVAISSATYRVSSSPSHVIDTEST